MEYKYHLAQLHEEEAQLYSFLYSRILDLANSFETDAPVETIQRVMKAIMLDNPQLYWFEGKWKASQVENSVRIFPKYKMRTDHAQRNAYIIHSVETVAQICSGSDAERMKTVYDWLIANVRYSYSDNDQTVEGAFIDRKAVCKGIAKAFQLCMNRLQIPSFLIEGTIDGQTPHVWNVVFTEGRFYHVDVTMGYSRFAALFRGMDRNKHYPCFLVSDATITATHRIYPGQNHPCEVDFDLDGLFVRQLAVPMKLRQYGILRYLDKGSTCTVMKVTGSDCEYALKVINAGGNTAQYESACAEREKLKMLSDCGGIVRLVDEAVFEETGRVFLLLRHCKPLTVRRKEKDFDPVTGTLKIGIDILDAMIACRNRGIYHLDIQPKNIYFDEAGKAVLGDFGGARFAHELHGLKRCMGTLAFMAPEVYHSGIYGQASEIYALGIVLYALLNHAKLPFMEDHDLEDSIKLRLGGAELPVPRGCGKEIWQWVGKLCAFDLSERYSTYEEARAGLAACLLR